MRVLHVTESRSWSGGTVQLWNLCRGLIARGHAAALFCPPEAELQRHTPESAVEVTVCPLREDYDVLAAGRLARQILVEGKSPASLPIRATTKGLPVISLARAKKLGIAVRSEQLLAAQVIATFEWDKP